MNKPDKRQKLTDEQVKEIRRKHIEEFESIEHLAVEYGVTFMTISNILHNRTRVIKSQAQRDLENENRSLRIRLCSAMRELMKLRGIQ